MKTFFISILFLLESTCLAIDIKDYPGWPKLDVPEYNGNDSVGACQKRVQLLYQTFNPLVIFMEPKHVIFESNGATQFLGVTAMHVKSQGGQRWVESDVHLWDHSIDTIHHEMAHALNAAMRGDLPPDPFFEEGTATAVEWILRPEAFSKKHVENLKKWRYYYPLKSDLRECVMNHMKGQVPSGIDYPLAAFVVMQLVDSLGPQAVFIDIPKHKETALAIIDRPEFWEKLDRNLYKWIEDKEQVAAKNPWFD